MIYAMSDIHGFADIFQKNLKRIDLSGENRLVLLGDYIDYGPESGRTLRLIFEMQKRYGAEKVIHYFPFGLCCALLFVRDLDRPLYPPDDSGLCRFCTAHHPYIVC